MNGKLLKICTAVMLITGVGDVTCQEGEYGARPMDTESNQQSKKRKFDLAGWGDSVSASVKGEVQAIVKVRSGENAKELKLFEVDGTITDEIDRTFQFEVLSIGAGGTVTVRGGEGMVYHGQGQWKIFAEGYTAAANQGGVPFVRAVLEMYDGFGNRVMLDNNNSASVDKRGKFRNEEIWKLILKPSPLDENSVRGKYLGNLSVVVSANG